MKTMFKHIMLALLLSGSVYSIKAQNTSFVGNWKLIQRESVSGKEFANGVPETVKIRVDKKSLQMERATATGNTDNPFTLINETLNFDGKAFVTVTPTGKNKTVTVQQGTDQLTFTEKIVIKDPVQKDKVVFNRTDVWTISADGQTLTLVHTDSGADPAEDWSMKGVYTKQ